jgi:predicted nucleic acid-binding protein
MVALDTSAVIAYLAGDNNAVARSAEAAFERRLACLAPVALAELLSDPVLPPSVAALLKDLPRLEITDGYWERAGALRARVLGKGLKARLADALIAQSCLDHRVPLVTADRDFRHFTRHGLELMS